MSLVSRFVVLPHGRHHADPLPPSLPPLPVTAPIYMACLVVCILVGFSSDKFKEKPFHILGCAVVSGISFIIVSQVRNHTIQYVFITFGGAGSVHSTLCAECFTSKEVADALCAW